MASARINSNSSAATRNPIQPRPAALPEQRARKLGPGTLRPAASLAGPAQRQPLINADKQSARSNQATFGTIPIRTVDPLNSRVIDRAGLSQTQEQLYGGT